MGLLFLISSTLLGVDTVKDWSRFLTTLLKHSLTVQSELPKWIARGFPQSLVHFESVDIQQSCCKKNFKTVMNAGQKVTLRQNVWNSPFTSMD